MKMAKDLDIPIEEALKAYLTLGVENQVVYQKLFLYSIVTDRTAYPENDTVKPQLDTVNDTVNTQPDTVSELKDGLKRIYAAIRKKSRDYICVAFGNLQHLRINSQASNQRS